MESDAFPRRSVEPVSRRVLAINTEKRPWASETSHGPRSNSKRFSIRVHPTGVHVVRSFGGREENTPGPRYEMERGRDNGVVDGISESETRETSAAGNVRHRRRSFMNTPPLEMHIERRNFLTARY